MGRGQVGWHSSMRPTRDGSRGRRWGRRRWVLDDTNRRRARRCGGWCGMFESRSGRLRGGGRFRGGGGFCVASRRGLWVGVASSRGSSRNGQGGGESSGIKPLQLLQLFLNEVRLVVPLVPRPNELEEEEGLGEGSHLFRSSLRSKGQQL